MSGEIQAPPGWTRATENAPLTTELQFREGANFATLLVEQETARDRNAATERLLDLANMRPGLAKFFELGGWPAMEMEFAQMPARRGQALAETDQPLGRFLRATVAVAVDRSIVRFEIRLTPGAPAEIMRQALSIAKGVTFQNRGRVADANAAVARLRARAEKPSPPSPVKTPPPPRTGSSTTTETTVGVPVETTGNRGELELAATADAVNTVIAAVGIGNVLFSTNSGVSYAASTIGGNPFISDPTVTRGMSDAFYLGHINRTANCDVQAFRSTDRGATFNPAGNAVSCAATGTCFPDQPHLVADTRNQAGSNDQIYAVWRHFTVPIATNCSRITSGATESFISCSKDGGATWTTRKRIPGVGDYPRVSVGADGAVYTTTVEADTTTNAVTVLLNEFKSCSSGLTAVGTQRTVTSLQNVAAPPAGSGYEPSGVACPVPGLDRCLNLQSATIAPNLDDSKRLKVVFAERDPAGGERIVSMASTNRGVSFAARESVSHGPAARRFMPWSCFGGGITHVGWYDRSVATAADNSLTDYFVSGPTIPLRNVSRRPDSACGWWPIGTSNVRDGSSCTNPVQLAGRCMRNATTGSNTPCDLNAAANPCTLPSESCRTGGGLPKYGDYNGMACTSDFVIAAWVSHSAPGLPAGGNQVRVMTEHLPIERPPFDYRPKFPTPEPGFDIRSKIPPIHYQPITFPKWNDPCPICAFSSPGIGYLSLKDTGSPRRNILFVTAGIRVEPRLRTNTTLVVEGGPAWFKHLSGDQRFGVHSAVGVRRGINDRWAFETKVRFFHGGLRSAGFARNYFVPMAGMIWSPKPTRW